MTIFSHDNLLSLHLTLIKSAARLRGVHNGRRRKLFSVLSFYPDHQFFFDNLDGQGLQCWTFNFASHSVPISLVISHIRHDRAGETKIVLTLSIRRNFINLSIDWLVVYQHFLSAILLLHFKTTSAQTINVFPNT